MNRQTALSLLAAAAFGVAMASTSMAGAVDNGQSPSQKAHCERVIDGYFACVTGCDGLTPSQIGRCQDACWTDEVSECADTSSSRHLSTTRTARTARPQATLQRRP